MTEIVVPKRGRPAGDEIEKRQTVENEIVGRLIELVNSGMNLNRAAQMLGVGYSMARRYIERFAQAADLSRFEGMMDVDDVRFLSRRLMKKRHPLVKEGRIVRDEDGTRVEDAGPALAAGALLLKASKRRSEIYGVDKQAPVSAPAASQNAEATQMTPEQERLAFVRHMARFGLTVTAPPVDIESTP
jgi:hypothetical protein